MSNQRGSSGEPPLIEGFWFEEVKRGSQETLIVMFGADSRGAIDVANYEEKAAWTKALEIVNSTLQKLLRE